MPPAAVHPYARKATLTRAIPPDPQEIAHLTILAADTIEALPPALTRSLSDLKELDAVLNTSLQLITSKLGTLLDLIEDANVTPAQRLAILKEAADEASGFKLGGEDKIRVATGTCESILHHAKQLDLITSLMTSLMPQHLLELIPASSTPSGYPHLFPSYGSATAASLYRPRSDFFPPSTPAPAALGGPTTGITRASQATYNQAIGAVQRYQQEGPLPAVGTFVNSGRSSRVPPAQQLRKPPPLPQAPRARTISQASHIAGTAAPVEVSGPESPPVEALLSPITSKKRQRAPPPPVATATAWDVPVNAEIDNGSNAGSPASVATNGRVSKRPRSTPTANHPNGNNGGHSPVGERQPSLSGKPRRSILKRPSPDPRVPMPAARERPPPITSRPRRAAVPEVPDEVLEAPVAEGGEQPEPEILEAAVEGDVGGPQAPASAGTEPGNGNEVYCTCRRVSYGEMIGCDGEDCKIEWFHLSCVGLSDPPKGRWICPDCSKDERNLKKRRTT